MIHQFYLNGYHITLDVGSGSIHVTDELSAQAIRLMEHYPKEQVLEEMQPYLHQGKVTEKDLHDTLEQIETLRENGELFFDDSFVENDGASIKSGDVIKALCLHVAHTCNLTCSYCFAAQGKYKGEHALMPFSVGKQALDFLVAHSGTRRNLEVDFFGGEPLMNWEVVKQLVAYGRELETKHNKHFRFTLTTNGVLLNDEIMDYCNKEMHNVVLSLDGRKEVHDRFRTDYMGRGSYDVVVPKFQRFVEKRKGKGYYIRGTFTHYNPDFLQDILHMADLGFIELSMEPVVASPDDPAALTKEDMPIVFKQYELLAKEMIKRKQEGRPITFYHYTLDLENGPCLHKRIAGCGCGSEYMAVTPWGELFPCHQFVGDNVNSLGDVYSGIKNTDLRQAFQSCNLFSHPDCEHCWAKYFCSGGCAANNFHASGSLQGVYETGCDLFRKRLECALMMQAAFQDENEG